MLQVRINPKHPRVTNAGKDAAYRLARVDDAGALRHALRAENSGVKPHPQAIQNAHLATVKDAKVTSYVLNPSSESGRHKAIVIEAALGFNRANAGEFIAQLKDGVISNPAVAGSDDAHGRRFSVQIPMTGPKGSAIVTTGWIIRPGADFPDLTTAYIEKRRQKS